jgi:hypothetical protein
MMTKDKNPLPVVVAQGFVVSDINSEMPMEDLLLIDRINVDIGSDKNLTSFSLKTTGFGRSLCYAKTCDSAHILTFYTEAATFIYHGNSSYIEPMVESIIEALTRHSIPKASSATHRQLWWYAAGRVVYSVATRAVSNYARQQATTYVQQKVCSWWQRSC